MSSAVFPMLPGMTFPITRSPIFDTTIQISMSRIDTRVPLATPTMQHPPCQRLSFKRVYRHENPAARLSTIKKAGSLRIGSQSQPARTVQMGRDDGNDPHGRKNRLHRGAD